MKKLSYMIAFAVALCSYAALAQDKPPQDNIGTAATSTADNVGKSANQLAADVSKGAGQVAQDAQKGTGAILDAVGKFLSDLGKNMSSTQPAPSPQSPSPQTEKK